MATSKSKFYGAWLKTAWTGVMSTARAISFSVMLVVYYALWYFPLLAPYRGFVSFAIPLFIIIGYVFYRLLRAPWDLHKAQDVVVDTKQAEIESLTNRLTDYTNHQEFADELTALHSEACRELIDKGPDNLAAPSDRWVMDAMDWADKVRAVLTKYNCSKQEWNRFENVNSLDLDAYKTFRNKEVATLIIQTDRIGEISAEHARRAEALRFQ